VKYELHYQQFCLRIHVHLAEKINEKYFVCLLVCFESHEQYFSYLASVTITDDRASANLDLCLALMAFSSEGSLRATPTATRNLHF
jgi:hypothetical protein